MNTSTSTASPIVDQGPTRGPIGDREMNTTNAARRMGCIALAALLLIGGQAMASPRAAGTAPHRSPSAT